MEKAEREFLLPYLAATRERLLETVDRLTKRQQRFRPARDGWSVADCVEHVSIVEQRVLDKIQAAMLASPGAHVHAQPPARIKDHTVLASALNRSRRFIAQPETMPARRWTDFARLLRRFEAVRERSLRFAAVTQSDLRGHFLAHPQYGELDCYQWLLFVAAHSERHARQAEEVIADPKFPRAADAASA